MWPAAHRAAAMLAAKARIHVLQPLTSWDTDTPEWEKQGACLLLRKAPGTLLLTSRKGTVKVLGWPGLGSREE